MMSIRFYANNPIPASVRGSRSDTVQTDTWLLRLLSHTRVCVLLVVG